MDLGGLREAGTWAPRHVSEVPHDEDWTLHTGTSLAPPPCQEDAIFENILQSDNA